ncbi:MAG: hypothetical protein IJ877_06825 [Candidatus Gastranaerophilales bacterium]|nr:hypothetical protein [Candidatus Gastranaerophilales bacterium]
MNLQGIFAQVSNLLDTPDLPEISNENKLNQAYTSVFDEVLTNGKMALDDLLKYGELKGLDEDTLNELSIIASTVKEGEETEYFSIDDIGTYLASQEEKEDDNYDAAQKGKDVLSFMINDYTLQASEVLEDYKGITKEEAQKAFSKSKVPNDIAQRTSVDEEGQYYIIADNYIFEDSNASKYDTLGEIMVNLYGINFSSPEGQVIANYIYDLNMNDDGTNNIFNNRSFTSFKHGVPIKIPTQAQIEQTLYEHHLGNKPQTQEAQPTPQAQAEVPEATEAPPAQTAGREPATTTTETPSAQENAGTEPSQTTPQVSENSTTVPAETPVTETPATETPATETPVAETPATEAPVTETPATKPPATNSPATEPPITISDSYASDGIYYFLNGADGKYYAIDAENGDMEEIDKNTFQTNRADSFTIDYTYYFRNGADGKYYQMNTRTGSMKEIDANTYNSRKPQSGNSKDIKSDDCWLTTGTDGTRTIHSQTSYTDGTGRSREVTIGNGNTITVTTNTRRDGSSYSTTVAKLSTGATIVNDLRTDSKGKITASSSLRYKGYEYVARSDGTYAIKLPGGAGERTITESEYMKVLNEAKGTQTIK